MDAPEGSRHMETKVAIVTGASSGMGLDITKSLLARGYAVVATSRNASRRGTLVPSAKLAVISFGVAA